MPLPTEAEEFLRSNKLDPAEYELNRDGDLVHVGGKMSRAWTTLTDAIKAGGKTLLSMPGDLLQAIPVMAAPDKSGLRPEERFLDTLGLLPDSIKNRPDNKMFPRPRPPTEEELAAHPLTRIGKTLSEVAGVVPETSGTSPTAEAIGSTVGALAPAVGEALLRKGYPSIAASKIAPLLRGGTYALPAGQQALSVAERNIAHQKETAPDQPADIGEAGEKASAAAIIDAVLGKLVGQGALVRSIEGPAAGLLKRTATQGASGLVEGASSAAAQDLLAEGKINEENVKLGALAGAVGQGGLAAAVGGRGPRAEAAAAGKTPADDAAGFGVDKTPEEAAPPAEKPAYTEAEIAIILDPTKEYNPPAKYRGPHDDVIVDAKKAGLLNTPEDIQRLITAEDKVAAYRELYAEKAAKAPANRENQQTDEIAAQAEQAAAASEKFQKELEALTKQKKTLEKEILTVEEDATMPAGQKWAMRNAARQEMQTVEQNIQRMVDAHLKSRLGQARMDVLSLRPETQESSGPTLGPDLPPQRAPGEPIVTPPPMRPENLLTAGTQLPGKPLPESRQIPQQTLSSALVEIQRRVPADAFKRFLKELEVKQKESARRGQELTAEQLKEALENAVMPAAKAQEAEAWSLERALAAQRGQRETRDLFQRGGRVGGMGRSELLSGLPRKWMEGEQRVPFRAGSLKSPPMPERAETLAEQTKLVADPKSPKKAMLVTGDVTLPAELTAGLATQTTPHGDVVYNPAKVSRAEVIAAGRGEVFDGRLLGYTESLPAGDAVVTTKVNGVPDVVTEVTTTDNIDNVIANQQAVTKGKGETTTATPEEIAAERQSPQVTAMYSSMFGLTPEHLNKLGKQFKRSPAGSFLKAIHAVTASATDKMAARSPLQAAASERFLVMERDSRRMREEKLRRLDGYTEMLQDPAFIEWLHDRTDKQKTDYTLLPAKWQALAKQYLETDYVPHFHREQNEKNVLVRTSDGQYRKAIDQPNYYFWGLNKEIDDKLQNGTPEERADLEDKWVKHYQSFFKKASKDDALEALANIRGDFARVQVHSGQPLFAPVIREYGIPLPRDWRADPLESAVNYVRRQTTHMKWAEYVQNDPLMRRAFGVTQDSAGRDTKVADAKHRMTNADWQDAFRAGKRVDAEWTWNATPDKYKTASAEGVPLQSRDKVAEDLAASFTGRSLRPGYKLFDSLQRIASPVVMGHASKLRDISQSITTGGEYAPKVIDYAADVAKTFADMRGAADRARKAGYLERDPIAHEFPVNATSANSAVNWWADAINTAADSFRQYTGIKHLDVASKVLAYEPARAAVERQIKDVGIDKSPLVAEFGPPPSLLKTMSPADVVELTAATIADTVSPRYSAENVPHALLPQNKHMIGTMFRLMTWSVARYNKWYKHNWIPTAKPQRAERLVKSLFYGVIGGAATASLLEFLRDKKPAKLTMTEWFGLDDDTKWRELAPLVGGYIDAQGSLGVLGWAANKAIMYNYDRPAASADLDPMLPVLIAGQQTFNTLFNFANHASEKGWDKLDVHDLGKLSLELANVSQSARDIVSRLGLDDRKEGRDANREVKVFEQITGRSAKTGEKVKPPGFFYESFRRNPFTLSAELNEAKTTADVRRLLPQLKETAARGLPLPAIRGDEKIPAFYRDVARRRGLDYAQQLAERDARELTLDDAKRQLLGRGD